MCSSDLVRAHPAEGVDGPAEHVVEPPVLTGALNGHEVLGLLDHADDALVAPRVAADDALLGLGDIAADGAEADPGLDGAQGLDESLDAGGVGGQDVEGQYLSLT